MDPEGPVDVVSLDTAGWGPAVHLAVDFSSARRLSRPTPVTTPAKSWDPCRAGTAGPHRVAEQTTSLSPKEPTLADGPPSRSQAGVVNHGSIIVDHVCVPWSTMGRPKIGHRLKHWSNHGSSSIFSSPCFRSDARGPCWQHCTTHLPCPSIPRLSRYMLQLHGPATTDREQPCEPVASAQASLAGCSQLGSDQSNLVRSTNGTDGTGGTGTGATARTRIGGTVMY